MKDGLSEVAWGRMVERQAAETDSRVLQAFNMAQVSAACSMVYGGTSLIRNG